LSKEPNDILVMTTCKCRENKQNLVMSRTWFEEQLANKIEQGVKQERKRIIELLASKTFFRDEFIELIEGKEND
jgi:hypothetical protein